MKKTFALLVTSFSLILSGCSQLFENDGLLYIIGEDNRTYIVDFSDELLDDEIIYIPSSVRDFENGEPMPLIIGAGMALGPASDALKILYVTGGNTGFLDRWFHDLDNLEMVVYNTLTPTYFSDYPTHSTIEGVLKYGYFELFSHESYDGVIQHYYDLWDSRYGQQDWDPPAGFLLSRVSYHYNYDDSPNEGLYRIGMEYELGTDLTPPDDPNRKFFQFIGWSSDATTFIPYDFENSENDFDVQLYAHWE